MRKPRNPNRGMGMGMASRVDAEQSVAHSDVLVCFQQHPNRALARNEVETLLKLSSDEIEDAFKLLTEIGVIVMCPEEIHTLFPGVTQKRFRLKS